MRVDPATTVDQLSGPIHHGTLLVGAPVDEGFVDTVVDSALTPGTG